MLEARRGKPSVMFRNIESLSDLFTGLSVSPSGRSTNAVETMKAGTFYQSHTQVSELKLIVEFAHIAIEST